MAFERSTLVRLLANVTDYERNIARAQATTERFSNSTRGAGKTVADSLDQAAVAAYRNREAMQVVGVAATAMGVGLTGALVASGRAAISWQSSWAGVTKTVEGTPRQLAEIEQGLRVLARSLPASQQEIAGVAEAAGALGVKSADIVGFTKTMIDLGETTDLTSEQAAVGLSQLMNVMRTAPQDVDRLGSSLVALGNEGASTEAEILNMASYISGAASLIGASESDVLAMASALTSMGINAERGGGVTTRVMQDVYTAVAQGGDQLDRFAKVSGLSAAEFSEKFRTDPIAAIDAFTQGLGRIKESGGNVVATLGELGYTGTQDTAVLLQMAGAGDLLTRSLETGRGAWEANNALTDEAAKRYETAEAKLKIATNTIRDAGIELGEGLLPAVSATADGVTYLAGAFADLPDDAQGAVTSVAGMAGVATLAAGGFLLLAPRIVETMAAMRVLAAAAPATAAGLSAVSAAALPLLAVVSTGAAAVMLGEIAGGMSVVEVAADDLAPSLTQLGEGSDKAGEGLASLFENRTAWGSLGLGADEITTSAQALDAFAVSAENALGDTLADKINRGLDMGTSVGRFEEQIEQVDAALAKMVASGDALGAESAYERFVGAVDPAIADEVEARFENYNAAVADAAKQSADLAAGTGAAVGALAGAPPAVGAAFESLTAYAQALGLSEQETEELVATTQAWGEQLAGFVDPLGAYTTLLGEKQAAEQATAQSTADATASQSDSWADYVGDVTVSVGEYLAQVEKQVADQEAWSTNMLRLSGRVSQGTIDELARMGREGAPLVAGLVNASDDELARFDDVTAARSKEATDAWAEQLRLASPVLAAVGRTAGQGVVDELAAKLRAGTTTVAEIAEQYGVDLAGGINPVLSGLGKPVINLQKGVWTQGGRKMMAQGGIEDHTAQIAQPGTWRVWAEDETGGEAYIPLALGKRGRSRDIWREVGQRLGVEFAEFAQGGWTYPKDVPPVRSVAPYAAPIGTGGTTGMEAMRDATMALLAANPPEPAIVGGGAGSGGPTGAAVGGGIVAIGRWLQSQGARVSEHPAFGGVLGKHSRTGGHYDGRAIDVNTRAGQSALEMAELDALAPKIRAMGARVIWRAPGHYNHLHAMMAKGGILNPHVRDQGGPLRPGYTLNGTGGQETVIPNRRFHDAATLPRPHAAALLPGAQVAQTNHFHDVDPHVAAARAAVELERMLR